jgi:hypothetical protein
MSETREWLSKVVLGAAAVSGAGAELAPLARAAREELRT